MNVQERARAGTMTVDKRIDYSIRKSFVLKESERGRGRASYIAPLGNMKRY